MMKDKVCKAIRDFLSGVVVPLVFNDAVLFHVPKVNASELLTQFQPISLCNVLYKIYLLCWFLFRRSKVPSSRGG